LTLESSHNLRVHWASHQATSFACKNWHYSECLPTGKLVKVGVWEEEKFVGVVVFGRGANRNMLKPYGLNAEQGCELVRIALRNHKSRVSQITSLAIKMLSKLSPKLRLIVSYADPEMGHHGGVYQAGNWIYTGLSGTAQKVWYKGKWSHKRTIDSLKIKPKNLQIKRVSGKHVYLMPLDRGMRKQISGLSKPYPKRVESVESDTPAIQAGEGGATPISTLQTKEAHG